MFRQDEKQAPTARRLSADMAFQAPPAPALDLAGADLVMVDIGATAAAALPLAEAICRQWLPDGKRQGAEWIARNPTRQDDRPGSFSVNLDTGAWSDFATGDKGGDLVALVRYLDNAPTQGAAARRLAEWQGTAPADPAPRNDKAKADRPKGYATRPDRHPSLGAPTAVWEYHNPVGETIAAVCRFETDEGRKKEYRPLSLIDGRWHWKDPAKTDLPLYHLDRLTDAPDAAVIVCEGEKAADAAAALLPAMIGITSMHGAQSPGRSDWSPLAGREVHIWPDCDPAGAKYAAEVARLATQAGAASVRILDLAATFADRPPDPDSGWDAADALAEWARPAAAPAWLADHARWIDWQPAPMAADRKAKSRTRAENSEALYTGDMSGPAQSRAKPVRNPSGTCPVPVRNIQCGDLLFTGDDDKKRRVIDSQAAEIVAEAMRGHLAWDGLAGSWLIWTGAHWDPAPIGTPAEKLIADCVHVGTDPIGFRIGYLNGIVQIIQRRALLPVPAWPVGVVPFRNGLLDLTTRDLIPPTPDRALDWSLPHDYNPGADCPEVKAWLSNAVEGDAATVNLLRCWLAALVRGIPLQSFLLLLGRGGSGKGTFQRLATALVGVRNATTSTLRDLEENRFETAKLYGKRLCQVNEAGRHGGALNMLKAITGGDHIPLERKHVQQQGTFVFDGLVLMASNEELRSTDTTSGLERRRITVRFPRSATPAEKADWHARGGESGVLHGEIAGVINWLLELSEAEIRAAFDHPPERVAIDNLLGMAAGNSVAEWMVKHTEPKEDGWSQVGKKVELRNPDTGRVHFENADLWLYPNYLTWCLENGRKYPVELVKFKSTIFDMAEHLGVVLKKERHQHTRTRGIKGLSLLPLDERQTDLDPVPDKHPSGPDGYAHTGPAPVRPEPTIENKWLGRFFKRPDRPDGFEPNYSENFSEASCNDGDRVEVEL